jgi:hypothetical protein
VGVTAGSREVPGRKPMTRDDDDDNNNDNNNNNNNNTEFTLMSAVPKSVETILWNQQVKPDRAISNNGPDI